MNKSGLRFPKTHGIRLAVLAAFTIIAFHSAEAAPPQERITQLRVSSNHRYLVDQNNHPFLMQGDAAWSLIAGLNQSDVEEYLKNRHDKGFNTIMVNLIEHKFIQHPPLNAAGDAPFVTPGDFSTPNEKYFAYADWVIKKANDYGIQVLLAPIYLGAKGTDEGWIEEILKLDPQKCLEYGRYLGKRYKDYDNIIWLMGGDRNPESATEKVNLIAHGIREFDKRHHFTAHCHPDSPPGEQYASGDWLDINDTYTYNLVHEQLLADFNRTPVMPFFLIESSYEGEHNSSEVQIRRQAYWSVLCGGFGHIMGDNPIWHFDGPTLFPINLTWQQSMDLPGSVGMMYWGRFFRSRAWNDLVPDQKHVVVTGGLGEFKGLDYLSAARSADGSTVMAYMPTSRKITVDLSKMSAANVKGWWFDPRTGKASAAGEFTTTGSRDFVPPGEGDWVLLLEDAAKQLPPPGSN